MLRSSRLACKADQIPKLREQASEATAMDTDSEHKAAPPAAGGGNAVGLLPEIEAYAYLLTVMYLTDQEAYKKVSALKSCS